MLKRYWVVAWPPLGIRPGPVYSGPLGGVRPLQTEPRWGTDSFFKVKRMGSSTGTAVCACSCQTVSRPSFPLSVHEPGLAGGLCLGTVSGIFATDLNAATHTHTHNHTGTHHHLPSRHAFKSWTNRIIIVNKLPALTYFPFLFHSSSFFFYSCWSSLSFAAIPFPRVGLYLLLPLSLVHTHSPPSSLIMPLWRHFGKPRPWFRR